MPTGRSGIAAGVVGGKLYVFGGEQPRLFSEVEVYDPAEDRWQSLPPMPTPRHDISPLSSKTQFIFREELPSKALARPTSTKSSWSN